MYSIKSQGDADGLYDVGSISFSAKSSSYFSFKTLTSCQGWREKWFYIRNSAEEPHSCGIPTFSASRKVTAKVSWKHALTSEESAEVSDLMNRIETLHGKVDITTFGLRVTAMFVNRRVQPLQARAHPMWEYAGPSDETRTSEEELTRQELKDKLVAITSLTRKDKFEASPREMPFGEVKSPPEVRYNLPF